MTNYQLDDSLPEDDFRSLARQRLNRQVDNSKEVWLPLIDDSSALGRLLGYTAVWTAMIVHENHQAKTF